MHCDEAPNADDFASQRSRTHLYRPNESKGTNGIDMCLRSGKTRRHTLNGLRSVWTSASASVSLSVYGS